MTSSRPCHDKLRIPFIAWILCTVAICLGINLHLHGIDSPVVWDWVARRRVERHEKVIVNVSFAQHAHCQQDTEQPAFQPSVHMAAVNGTILGGSLDQNDAKNEIDNSHLQQSVLEAAHEPTESFVEREKNAASQNSYSVPQRRSQGSRRRYKERALKSFSSHKHKMTQFFQICADESRASFSEKQRLGVVYHKMLCKKALTSDDQRFFSNISKIFSPHRTQSVPSAVQAALPSVLELGAFAAGTDHFVADTPAPTTDTLLDTQNNAVHVAKVADENTAAGSVNDFAQDACNFACDFQPVENAENAENAQKCASFHRGRERRRKFPIRCPAGYVMLRGRRSNS